MRPTYLVAVLGAALALVSGCGDKDSKGKKAAADASQPATARTGSASASSESLAQADAYAPTLSSLKSEDNGPVPVADEDLASRSSKFFDGNRTAGSLNLPQSGTVAAGDRSTWRSAPKVKPNSSSRRVTPDGGGVPKPGTGPAVDLPTAESSDGASAGAKGSTKGSVLLAFESFQKKVYDTVSPVFSRSAWRAKAARSVSGHQVPARVTVHHTDGKQTFDEGETLASVRNIQAFHMNTADAKHGWDDIGYHFLIDGAGRIVEGRHPDVLGAHAQGANENNIGIAMLGDYNRDKPTAAQLESLRRLVSFLALKYRANPKQKGFLQPHMHYNNTDCPGKNMVAVLDTLRQQIDAETDELVQRMGTKDGAVASAGAFIPLTVTRPSDS